MWDEPIVDSATWEENADEKAGQYVSKEYSLDSRERSAEDDLEYNSPENVLSRRMSSYGSRQESRKASRRASIAKSVKDPDIEVEELFDDTEQWIYVLKSLCLSSWLKDSNKEYQNGSGNNSDNGDNDSDNDNGGNNNIPFISKNNHINTTNDNHNNNNNNNKKNKKSKNKNNTPQFTYTQGLSKVPEFWGNLDINPIIVEAAVGFSEIYPLNPLVPGLPKKLYQNIEKFEDYLLTEQKIVEELGKKKEVAKVLRNEIESSVHIEGVRVSLLFFFIFLFFCLFFVSIYLFHLIHFNIILIDVIFFIIDYSACIH